MPMQTFKILEERSIDHNQIKRLTKSPITQNFSNE